MTRKLGLAWLGTLGLMVPACYEHHTADEKVEIPAYDDDNDNSAVDDSNDGEGNDQDDDSDEGDYPPTPPKMDAGVRVDAGVDAGVRRDAGVDAGTRTDAGTRDAGADAGRDAGTPRDAGTARDAGAAGRDAGAGNNPAAGIAQLLGCDRSNNDAFLQLICGVITSGDFLGGGTGTTAGGFIGGNSGGGFPGGSGGFLGGARDAGTTRRDAGPAFIGGGRGR